MPSKLEPPICVVEGWKQDQQRHSLQKSFHFTSEEPMNEFWFSILTNHHDRFANLSAVQCQKTKDIQVEVFSKKMFQKEIFDIIKTIESCYRKTQEDFNGNSSAFWSWWFKSFDK